MGRDKSALPVDGPGGTLSQRTARMLLAHTAPCVELGPGTSGLPHHPDPGRGPLVALAGAASVWETLPDDSDVLVVATDLPRLTPSLVAWLVAHPAAGAVVPVDEGRRQPLCARYPVAALRATPAVVASGATSLKEWLAGLDVHDAGPDEWVGAAGDAWALRDADTPEELAALSAAGPGAPPAARAR